MPAEPADPSPARPEGEADPGSPPQAPTAPAGQPLTTTPGQVPLWLPVGSRIRLLVRRGIQFAVDVALVAAACLVPLLTLTATPRNPDGSVGGLLLTIPLLWLVTLACVAITWWYWAWRPAAHDGQTPGMQLVHVRVVDASGGAASRGQLSLRWLALLVDLAAFCAVGAAAILVTPRGQRFGDLLASTLVVDTPRRSRDTTS